MPFVVDFLKEKGGQVNPSQVRAPDQTKSHLEINKSNQQYSSPGANAFARREGGGTAGRVVQRTHFNPKQPPFHRPHKATVGSHVFE